MEQGGLYSSVAGLGAGFAASSKANAAAIGRSFQSVVRAQESIVEQTKAVEMTMKQACQCEAAKQWENAENGFRAVLQGIARRDGPGSRASVPVLKHLVTVTEKQNKLDDAINYQKTVVAFTKAERVPDQQAVTTQQLNLSNLMIEKNDYVSAEPVLHEVAQAYKQNPSLLTEEQRSIARIQYSLVLSKLHKRFQDEMETAQAEPPKPAQTAQVEPQNSTQTIQDFSPPKEEASQLLEAVTQGILSKQARLIPLPGLTGPAIQESQPEAELQLNNRAAVDRP